MGHLKRASLILAAATLAVGLRPGQAVAGPEQDFPGVRAGVSFGPRAALFIPKDQDAEDGKLHGGAQLRLHLGKAIALEGSADYRRNRFGSGPTSTRVDIFPVQASLLAYLLPDYRLTPYLIGGAGWYFTRVKGPGGVDDTDNRFGPHAGAGLQMFLHRNWSLDSSWRYVWVEEIQSRDAALGNKEFEDQGHMITLGLNYHF